MAASQIFVLSSRGDCIISKDFRGDAFPGMQDAFFRRVRFWIGDAPPVFELEGMNFLFVKKSGLLFVATTRFNSSPTVMIEMLNRIAKVIKDFCGVLTEESMRKNFVLIYELIDEMMDFGYPQMTSPEQLRSFIHNEPVLSDAAMQESSIAGTIGSIIQQSGSSNSIFGNSRTVPSTASQKPISMSIKSGKHKNEIFVDILERINVTVRGSDGQILSSSIDGSIIMKSYLSGSPEVKIALNEDLVLGKSSRSSALFVDDVSFHEVVRLDEFESSRTLSLFPPDGEISVMNYRITNEFRLPFRIMTSMDEISPFKFDVVISLSCDISDKCYVSNLIMSLPLPRSSTSSSTCESQSIMAAGSSSSSSSAGQQQQQVSVQAEVKGSEHLAVWNIKKLVGGGRLQLVAHVNLENPFNSTIRREIGPLALTFEIPMHSVSGMQVKHLRISETHKSYNPQKWVRYVTQSSSYMIRLT